MAVEWCPVIPVTVIIPNFNSAKFLRECISSINSGSNPGEIIVVDDGSDDGSLEIAKDLSNQYSNVRLIIRERNGGAAAARYDGIASAIYDWVAFIDADDFVEPGAIQGAYLKAIEDNADMCILDMWRFESHRSWLAIPLNAADFPMFGRDAVVRTLGAWKIHPLSVARKNLYESAYRDFSETCLNADELLTRLVFAEAGRITRCEYKYFYRVNPESSTRKRSPKLLTLLDSHLWLLKFSRSYPEVKTEELGKHAIAAAWSFWAQRRAYPGDLVVVALCKFMPELVRVAELSKWLWRYPKHAIAFALIFAMVMVKGRQ